MKNVVSWLGDHCEHCIKCLKSCPMDAISIVDHQVVINEDLCIHCDVCIKECPERLLKVQGAHMSETLHEHEYNIILIPTSLLSDMKSFDEFQQFAHAILELGFDEVAQYSDIEGYLYKQALSYSHHHDGVWLTSFCPTVNQYIEKNYPTLFDHLLPYDYPVEIAARLLRKKYNDKNIGIYSLCECVGKMTLAKQPFDNQKSSIDYALSISHVFPKMNKLKGKEKLPIQINKYGVKSIVQDFYGNKDNAVMRIAGFNQAKSVLDLIEFDQIKHVDLITMYACYQGCIGGYYLWSNPFEGCINISNMIPSCHEDMIELDEKDYLLDRELNHHEMKSMKERIDWFNKVNEVLDTLPQYDCGACGFANCRSLAQGIVDNQVSIEICRVRKGD